MSDVKQTLKTQSLNNSESNVTKVIYSKYESRLISPNTQRVCKYKIKNNELQ